MDKERVEQIKIVRCHIFGVRNPKSTNPFPIICKFHFFGDRQETWSKMCQLKGSDFIMQEDFPQEINAKRSQLAPIMFAARKLDMKNFLVANKHIING